MGSGQGGTTAGNIFTQKLQNWDPGNYNSTNTAGAVSGAQNTVDATKAINGGLNYSIGQAGTDVQNNPIYSGLFGNGGQLQSAENQLNDEAKNGFSLTPQDYTAYGEASGNISRMFGQSQNSLAQALANRGISNSGVAGADFATSLGNQNEQLAQLQTQIAQQRMNFNQQQMKQTQDYISQLGAQAQGAMGQALGEKNIQEQEGMGYLEDAQNQSNEQSSQYAQTNKASPGSQLLQAGLTAAGTALGGPIGGAVGSEVGSMFGGSGSGSQLMSTTEGRTIPGSPLNTPIPYGSK